jgi:transcriptional regulator with XRE-family HTH domain
MAGHFNYELLRQRMSPERRQRVKQGVNKELRKMLLTEFRRVAGMTQVKLAKSMGVTQPTLSRLESQDDMQLSTLRRIVEALGGELEVIAKLPNEQVALSQFKPRRRKLQPA